eukprot:16335828-Heterocapsa_arctica.AAC.1
MAQSGRRPIVMCCAAGRVPALGGAEVWRLRGPRQCWERSGPGAMDAWRTGRAWGSESREGRED